MTNENMNLEHMDLLARAKNGDSMAFGELVMAHEKMIYNVAYRMMNHSEDAYDISQEVLIKAYRNLKNFDEKSQFSTWLYRIAVNTCIDEMRKRKGKQTVSMDQELEGDEGSWKQEFRDTGDTPEEHLVRKEEQSEITQALETLSEEHKTVVVLRDVKGLSYEEIAEITELSLGTVKSRISRGRQQLKAEILKIWEQNGKVPRQRDRKEGR